MNGEVSITVLESILGKAWSRETSSEPKAWSSANSAIGQCAVTALVVQDFLGGHLLRGKVGSVSHYWNLLPSGQQVDLTIGQFGTSKPTIRDIAGRTRDYVLSFPETQVRYKVLIERVQKYDRETSGEAP
jgi:hypothetical protein